MIETNEILASVARYIKISGCVELIRMISWERGGTRLQSQFSNRMSYLNPANAMQIYCVKLQF